MKRILYISLLIFLVSCSYKSSFEAKKACNKWASNGKLYQYKKDIDLDDIARIYNFDLDDDEKWDQKIVMVLNRYCINDKSSQKYLGFEYKEIEDKKNYKEFEIKQLPIAEVVKRFNY